MKKSLKKVMDADVFDALEFSALVFDGIGAGQWFETDEDDNFAPSAAPCCVEGHAITICDTESVDYATSTPAIRELDRLDISFSDNDQAVQNIRLRLNGFAGSDFRVTFEQWCEELGVVRGPHKYTEPFCDTTLCNDGPCTYDDPDLKDQTPIIGKSATVIIADDLIDAAREARDIINAQPVPTEDRWAE